MTLEAGKEMDRRCVINWLNEVYVTPSRAFDEYTEDELKMFAYDALVLLKEQETIVRCKDCKYAQMTVDGELCKYCGADIDEYGYPREVYHEANWFCADGERR
jgi:hypothetical protein